LAQIEGDCITPIFLIIEKVGKKQRFSLIPLTFILTRTSNQLLANWGATSQINADSELTENGHCPRPEFDTMVLSEEGETKKARDRSVQNGT